MADLVTKRKEFVSNQKSPLPHHHYGEWIALGLILVLGAGLRLWRLDQNGYGTEYYAAGVRSMLNNWHNFFYNSFDPAGFVSLDKPPVALWIQVASAKLFGFHGLSLLIPQALAGLGAIGLVYALVRRYFGGAAGLLSALFLAVTPVAVATDRSNNTDSGLILVLLLAAWAMIRAAEQGRRSFLLLSMALVGLGFNVKMMAAFVLLPTLGLVYFLGAPLPLKRRIIDLTLSGLVLITVSLSWVLFYDLTPSDRRPFVGSTKGNSMLELTVGHNALGRFVRRNKPIRPSVIPTTGVRTDKQTEGTLPVSARDAQSSDRWSKIFVRVPVGPLRLADRHLAGQVAWLFPLAILGLIAAFFQSSFSLPLRGSHQLLLLWTGWALTYGIIYSYAGGIFHFYYLATLGPSLAGLAGIGLVALWNWFLERNRRSLFLPAAFLLTAFWQAYIESGYLGWKLDLSQGIFRGFSQAVQNSGDRWPIWLFVILLFGSLGAAVGLLLFRQGRPSSPWGHALTPVLAGIGLFSLLVTPGAWALSSVLSKEVAMLPSADLSRLVNRQYEAEKRASDKAARRSRFRKLLVFLKTNYRGERFLLATSSARLAAPIIVRTGDAVMAMGGFHGLDPILTPDKLAGLVKENQLRFVMLGDFSVSGRILGAEAAEKPLADWVRKNGRPVDPALWRYTAFDGEDGEAKTLPVSPEGGTGSLQLYDLRPDPFSVRSKEG